MAAVARQYLMGGQAGTTSVQANSVRLPQALAKDRLEANVDVVDARCSNIVPDTSRPEATDWKELAKVHTHQGPAGGWREWSQ